MVGMTNRIAAVRMSVAGVLTLAIAGCAAVPTPEAPPPAPAPRPVAPAPAPAPAPTTKSWEERALNAGAWRYDAGNRTAAFVPAGGAAPLLSLTCSGGSIRMTSTVGGNANLRTTAGTDPIQFDGGGASLSSRDPRLDRMAFSRGRFALESASGALTLPVQSEIGRVIEDCR